MLQPLATHTNPILAIWGPSEPNREGPRQPSIPILVIRPKMPRLIQQVDIFLLIYIIII